MGSYTSPNCPPTSKRPRLDDKYNDYDNKLSGPADYKPKLGFDFQKNPVRVVSVIDLHDIVTEFDLIDALSDQYGSVSYVSLTGRGTALIEFEEIASAERIVRDNLTIDIMVLNKPAKFDFSNLHTVPRLGLEGENPSRVLVMYVKNLKYPITTDVINAICKPISRLIRIKIIRATNSVQCLVEFENVDAARLIRKRLNGCNIYTGCCTLKVEFSKFSVLHITKDNVDEAKFVTPPSTTKTTATDRPALLQHPPVFTAPPYSGPSQNQAGWEFRVGRPSAAMEQQRYPVACAMPYGPVGCNGRFEFRVPSPSFEYGSGGETFRGQQNYGNDGGHWPTTGYGMGEENSVLLIHGLRTEMVNCDKLFNLFCQYGNVVRINFLKHNSVMLQMGDPVAAQRAIENLKFCTAFGVKMSVTMSHKRSLYEIRHPYELPDKTLSSKDYLSSRKNRFLSFETAIKNRLNPPQKFLYFFNAPPNVSEQELLDIMKVNGAPKPVSAEIFIKQETFTKNSAGMFEFENEDDAVDALMLCNHFPFDSQGKSGFVLKLVFAGPPNSSGRVAPGGYCGAHR